MPKKHISIRVNEMTRQQIAGLQRVTGMNQTEIISLAVDRLAQSKKEKFMGTTYVIVSERYGEGEGTLIEINECIEAIDFDYAYETTVRGVQVLRNSTGIVAVEKGHEKAAW